MRRYVCSAIFLVILCATVRAASAQVIITGGSFSGSTFDLIGITPFDPAVGTLDSVNVTIDGKLTVSGTTLPLIVQGGPIPYPYQVSVTQDFSGFANRFFEFDSAAVFTMPSVAFGIGEPFTLATSFSYGFSFTSATDLSGGVIFPSFSTTYGTLTPPTSVSGMRADFHESIFGVHEVDLVQTWSALSFGPGVSINSVLAEGALLFQYNYTPTAPIPEPEIYAMLGLGLGLTGWVGRRRKLQAA